MKKPKLIRCIEVADHICENLDSDLHQKKCREIQEHIRKCPNCYAYLDSMKKTVHLYKIERTPAVPKRLRSQLFAVLNLRET